MATLYELIMHRWSQILFANNCRVNKTTRYLLECFWLLLVTETFLYVALSWKILSHKIVLLLSMTNHGQTLILWTICFLVFLFHSDQLQYSKSRYHMISNNSWHKTSSFLNYPIRQIKKEHNHAIYKLKKNLPLRYLAKIIILTVTLNKTCSLTLTVITILSHTEKLLSQQVPKMNVIGGQISFGT